MSYDRYVYPGTMVLINKFGIEDEKKLHEVERGYTLRRTRDLREKGVTGRFDRAHIQAIHKELFGAIYDWAGEFRDVTTYKGGTEFAKPEEIIGKLNALAGEIRDADYFRGLPKKETAAALSSTMAKLNLIHPFREGNGRTQRIFMEQLAMNAGYELDLSKVSENDMRNASIAANIGRGQLMTYLFESNMEPTGTLGPVKIEEAPARSGEKKSVWAKLKSAFSKDGGQDDRDYDKER